MKNRNYAAHCFLKKLMAQRLDLFLVQQMTEVSRSRVQLLLQQGSVLIDGSLAQASRKLRSAENISILGIPNPSLARHGGSDSAGDCYGRRRTLPVVNKRRYDGPPPVPGRPMMRGNRGTLVNALLHHLRELSSTSGPLRPGLCTVSTSRPAPHRGGQERRNPWPALVDVRPPPSAQNSHCVGAGELAQERGTVMHP